MDFDYLESQKIDNWKNGFNTLSAENCGKVYLSVLENAKRHLKISCALADISEYGNAISHSVLASEEALKSLILFADYKGFNLRNEVIGASRFFKDHVIRHETISFIQILYSVIGIVFNMLDKLMPFSDITFESINKNKISSLVDNEANGLGNHLENAFWWEQADYYKQRGFYVGYYNGILSPVEFDIADYKIAYDVSNDFILFCDRVITYANNMSEDELREMRTRMKQTGIYDHLSKFTNKRKK
jgi:AbiV family abortive infection protein